MSQVSSLPASSFISRNSSFFFPPFLRVLYLWTLVILLFPPPLLFPSHLCTAPRAWRHSKHSETTKRSSSSSRFNTLVHHHCHPLPFSSLPLPNSPPLPPFSSLFSLNSETKQTLALVISSAFHPALSALPLFLLYPNPSQCLEACEKRLN